MTDSLSSAWRVPARARGALQPGDAASGRATAGDLGSFFSLRSAGTWASRPGWRSRSRPSPAPGTAVPGGRPRPARCASGYVRPAGHPHPSGGGPASV